MIQLTRTDEKNKGKRIFQKKSDRPINTFKEGIPFVQLKNAAVLLGNGESSQFTEAEEKRS